MSRRPLTPADVIGNIAVLIGLAIVGAWGVDWVWVRMGGTPWMLCGTMTFMQASFGPTVGFILVCLGFIVFFLSGMKRGEYLVLALGGLLLTDLSSVFASFLGISCP